MRIKSSLVAIRPLGPFGDPRQGRFGRSKAAFPRGPKAGPRSHAHAAPHSLNLKRAYEHPSRGDGTRVLVDRLWPRGVSKERLALDFWLRDLAPSDALRTWYGHRPGRWPLFQDRYRMELESKGDLLDLLDDLRRRGPVTLLYGARDVAHNHAVVLRAVLEERRTGSDQSR